MIKINIKNTLGCRRCGNYKHRIFRRLLRKQKAFSDKYYYSERDIEKKKIINKPF